MAILYVIFKHYTIWCKWILKSLCNRIYVAIKRSCCWLNFTGRSCLSRYTFIGYGITVRSVRVAKNQQWIIAQVLLLRVPNLNIHSYVHILRSALALANVTNAVLHILVNNKGKFKSSFNKVGSDLTGVIFWCYSRAFAYFIFQIFYISCDVFVYF